MFIFGKISCCWKESFHLYYWWSSALTLWDFILFSQLSNTGFVRKSNTIAYYNQMIRCLSFLNFLWMIWNLHGSTTGNSGLTVNCTMWFILKKMVTARYITAWMMKAKKSFLQVLIIISAIFFQINNRQAKRPNQLISEKLYFLLKNLILIITCLRTQSEMQNFWIYIKISYQKSCHLLLKL